MIKLSKKSIVSVIAGMTFLICLLSLPVTAQDLEKKYAPIVGDYEFDMDDSGMGVMTVKIYVENDAIWAYPQDMGEPGEMIPTEGKEFEFTIDDDGGSVWELKFLKNESGKYTKCHAVNNAQGMDITGEKIIK